jgi:phosphatidylglycerophosphatase A
MSPAAGTGERATRDAPPGTPARRADASVAHWSVLAALSTACGLGFTPVAPGTAGTLFGVAVFAVLAWGVPVGFQTLALVLATVLVSLAAVPLGHWAEHHWRSTDPRPFVVDEVAGFLLTVLLFRSPHTLLTAAWAFVFFRIFDIVKPPPARRAEKLPGGWGILLDDLVAAVYAAACLHVLALVAPSALGAMAH